MLDDLQPVEDAIRQFQLTADLDFVDLRRLSGVIDQLEGIRCAALERGKKRGEHLLAGQSACSWAAVQCRMSKTSAADRLCVGEQLDKLPELAGALGAGQVGYQSAAVICHLSEQLGEKHDLIDEEQWIGFAQKLSVKEMRYLAREARVRWDPEGFDQSEAENFELRSLDISQTLDGMYRVDGWLDPVGGAAFKAAIDSLARPLGSADTRSSKQRRADAVVELASGRPAHISVATTLEGLKGEVGASAAHLESGMPISNKTVQRLACDGLIHRVLKSDSMVVDVGRAKRTAQPAQWRALKARHRTCAGPDCDRPLSMTQAHHVDFWRNGGQTNHRKMLPLCGYHHRLVHEGGWQVVLAGERIEWIPPERPVMTRRRWGESRWAA
ncbi:MAG TPA: DUF222 domain-containing protein [Candidatus Dormibacteraeota bacterium]|nr:DUF222 domain-containing protein [Candidatus Dormibacteraeota bacterium]